MRAKVSVIVTCYNKELYIKRMLDSILNQIWDNIEVIIVDDGSTDKSDTIYNLYQSEFKNRGYEVNIIHQVNSGRAKATQRGLMAAAGEYICCVDADDELLPEYVSEAVEILSKNKEYEYTICDYVLRYPDKDDKRSAFKYYPNKKETHLVELILLWLTTRVHWTRVIRKSYLDRYNIVEKMYTGSDASQEEMVSIPLAFYGGKAYHIQKYLYINYLGFGHNGFFSGMGLTSSKTFISHNVALTHAIDVLPNQGNKEKMLRIAKLTHLKSMIEALRREGKSHTLLAETAQDFANTAREIIPDMIHLDADTALQDYFEIWGMIVNTIMDVRPPEFVVNKDVKIFVWGVLGARGKLIVPPLLREYEERLVLWDINETGNEMCGFPVSIPDITKLTKTDVVIVLPIQDGVYEEVKAKCEPLCLSVISYSDITSYLASQKYKFKFGRE